MTKCHCGGRNRFRGPEHMFDKGLAGQSMQHFTGSLDFIRIPLSGRECDDVNFLGHLNKSSAQFLWRVRSL